MARPIKTGLDYFPMDVDTDDKFELIEAKHGLVGFAIIIKLYQRIYKSGYYIDWNEEKLLLLKKSINVDINSINEVINDCFRYNIFDETLYEKYSILTSSGIQKRFFAACDRRKSLELVKEYINVDINSINVAITWVNVRISTQSKEKESKEKESKEKKKGKEKIKIQELFYPPFSQKFLDAWLDLIKMPKWAKKPDHSLQLTLKSLGKYDEEFAIELIERAIEGNWQGVIFSNTANDFEKWKQKKGGQNGRDQQISDSAARKLQYAETIARLSFEQK